MKRQGNFMVFKEHDGAVFEEYVLLFVQKNWKILYKFEFKVCS